MFEEKKWNLDEWVEYCEESQEIKRKIGNGKKDLSKKDIYEYFEYRASYVIGAQKKHTLFIYIPDQHVLDAKERRNEISLVRKLRYDAYCTLQEEKQTVQYNIEKVKKLQKSLQEAGADISDKGIENLKKYEKEEREIDRKIQAIEGELSDQELINKLYTHTYVTIKSEQKVSEIESKINKQEKTDANYDKAIRMLENKIQQNPQALIEKEMLEKKEDAKSKNSKILKKEKEELQFYENIIAECKNGEDTEKIVTVFDEKIDEKKLKIKPGYVKKKRKLYSIDIKFLKKLIEMFPFKGDKDDIVLELCKCPIKDRQELVGIIKELSEKNLLCNNKVFFTSHVTKTDKEKIEEEWKSGLEIRLNYPALTYERSLFALLFELISVDLKKGRERKSYFELEKEMDRIIDKLNNRFGDNYIERIKRKMNELGNLMEMGILNTYENGTLEDILNQEINLYQEIKGESVCKRLQEKIKKMDEYFEIWENDISLLQHMEENRPVKEIADYLNENPEAFSEFYTKISSLYTIIIEECGGEGMDTIKMMNDEYYEIMLLRNVF